MFNRRIILLIAALGFALGVLIWKWNAPVGIPLQAAKGAISSARWETDLSGQWDMYSSLRQAWASETEKSSTQEFTYRLTGGASGYLPSSQEIRVAARTFKIPAEWSARTLILQLQGVHGGLSVYLNGIESTHRIGSFESEGGLERLVIPVNALRHGQDNIILLELSAPQSQVQTLLGVKTPAHGKITGAISLQAVMETSIQDPMVQISWEGENATVQVDFKLIHYGFSEYGPWTVEGILSDGSAEVAQETRIVTPDENPAQEVSFKFEVPNGRKWSPGDPFLYQLYLTVRNPRGDKDDLAFPLALTSLRFEEGVFKQNNDVLSINGLAVLPEEEYLLRESGELSSWIREQKDKGYNLLYFLGDFPDELWFQEADKTGMGIWAELPGNLMVPASRLTQPEIWQDLIRSGTLHPSLWAFTAGKGLELNPKAELNSYWKRVQTLTDPVPTFSLRLTQKTPLPIEFSPRFVQDGLEGDWGRVEFPQKPLHDPDQSWAHEEQVSGIWALLSFFIAWANLTAKSWRYKELKTEKPKRALRQAWFWHGAALLSREMTLAGVVTSLLLHGEVPWSILIPDQWPLWEGLKQQSPLLIWLILGLILTLTRLFQVGVAAPHFPEAPVPMGLAIWLERRYLWGWIVAGLWALQSWGIPWYVPLLAYISLSLIFLPLRIRDVRRVGGKYASLCLVPGFLSLAFLIANLFRWADWMYLWKLVQALIG